MLIAVGVVLSIVLLRMWMYYADTLANNTAFNQRYSSIVVPVTSGLLNLISIMILNAVSSGRVCVPFSLSDIFIFSLRPAKFSACHLLSCHHCSTALVRYNFQDKILQSVRSENIVSLCS